MMLSIILVAFCLRIIITGVGPLLPEITKSLGLSGSASGLLTTLPVLPGAIFGGLAILAVSILFSTMISASARYTLVYGSLASLIILMLWLHLIGTIILLGGLVNKIYWQYHCNKNK